jgi:glycosyltransferase involved in cell wall biosynthesis
MDDWPETIYHGALLGPLLRALVDREFRELLSRAAVRMAISQAMASEYLARYEFEFEVFHNCIDVPWWTESRKTSWAVTSPLKVVYSGRVGWDALRSFRDVCEAIELMNQAGLPTQFRIYSPELETSSARALARYPHTLMQPPVEFEQLRSVLTGADVLVIPSDFAGWGRRFARLSMPTKVPAYMASGTPVLLYSPRTHAMCAWAEQAKWALVVGERSPDRLAQTLTHLATSPALREALSCRGAEIADREFDGRRVRAAFREALAGRSCPV